MNGYEAFNAHHRKRIAELEAENAALQEDRARLADALEVAVVALAALREDKARLDDVERQVPDGFDWTITRLDAGGWKVEPLRIGAELGWGPHYPTARAAIDAARKGEKG